VTQPDGLSRSDLIDPRAYSAIDVIRGPSSALYGNYATGGAINFRTRPGRTIELLEAVMTANGRPAPPSSLPRSTIRRRTALSKPNPTALFAVSSRSPDPMK